MIFGGGDWIARSGSHLQIAGVSYQVVVVHGHTHHAHPRRREVAVHVRRYLTFNNRIVKCTFNCNATLQWNDSIVYWGILTYHNLAESKSGMSPFYNCTAWHRLNEPINLCLRNSVPFLLYKERATPSITSSCNRHYRRNGTELHKLIDLMLHRCHAVVIARSGHFRFWLCKIITSQLINPLVFFRHQTHGALHRNLG